MNYAIDTKVSRPAQLIMPKHSEDAGVDIRWGYDFDIGPGQIIKIDTGIILDIPSGWAGFIFPRSSNNRMSLANEVGVIDSTYTGNVILKVESKSRAKLNIFEEDRDFQLVLLPHMIHHWKQVDKITKETTRGDGGFGSTTEVQLKLG